MSKRLSKILRHDNSDSDYSNSDSSESSETEAKSKNIKLKNKLRQYKANKYDDTSLSMKIGLIGLIAGIIIAGTRAIG